MGPVRISPKEQTGRAYLSGMGLGLWGVEEGVRQLPQPHGDTVGDIRAVRVHHDVKKRLQVRFRVSPNVDDLVSGRRVVLARIHFVSKLIKKQGTFSCCCFFFWKCSESFLSSWRAAGNLEISTPLTKSSQEPFGKVGNFALESALAVEIRSKKQRSPAGSTWHTCKYNKAHIWYLCCRPVAHPHTSTVNK